MNASAVQGRGDERRRSIFRYLIARTKLAFGRVMAAAVSRPFLRANAVSLRRIGTTYGGWWCCPALLGPERVALCCGAGEDISFDVALNAHYGMRVICVDPTPRAISHVAAVLSAYAAGRSMPIESGPHTYDMTGFAPERFRFVPCAVWSADGTLELFAPKDPRHVSYSALNLQRTSERIVVAARTIGSLMREYAAGQPALLKLDIEGAEQRVLRALLATGALPEQLLVEFDEVNQPLGPFFWLELLEMLRQLRAAGYDLVHREHANFTFLLRRTADDCKRRR